MSTPAICHYKFMENSRGTIKKIFLLQLGCAIVVIALFLIVYLNLDNLNGNTPATKNILEGINTEDKQISASSSTSVTNAFEPNPTTTSSVTTSAELKSGVTTTDKGNSLSINDLQIDGTIVQGPVSNQNNLLLQGFWLYPETGKPMINSRKPFTPVIFAHRLYKKPPEKQTFFNLDQAKEGEIVTVNFEHLVYYYKILSIRIVDKYDWQAIEPEDFNAIKLVTCTPLDTFDAPQRIVVTAKLIE